MWGVLRPCHLRNETFGFRNVVLQFCTFECWRDTNCYIEMQNKTRHWTRTNITVCTDRRINTTHCKETALCGTQRDCKQVSWVHDRNWKVLSLFDKIVERHGALRTAMHTGTTAWNNSPTIHHSQILQTGTQRSTVLYCTRNRAHILLPPSKDWFTSFGKEGTPLAVGLYGRVAFRGANMCRISERLTKQVYRQTDRRKDPNEGVRLNRSRK